jgi:lipoprotein signal peptidase
MSALVAALLLVPLIDQAVKVVLRRRLGSNALPLGPIGQVRVVVARLWLARAARSSPAVMWTLWMLSAAALVTASAWIPSSRLFVGLLLGGSLSNGLESALRGGVTDYVCLRFWPAFNLADVALTTGGIGVAAALAIAVQRTLS